MAIARGNNGSVIGIIPIRYSSEELLSILSNKDAYIKEIENKCETRKVEILSVRYLIYLLLGEEKDLIYSPDGKPQLADKSFHISISHTKGYVAVVLNKEHEVGIDIEYISSRVSKIRKRFLNKQEEENIVKENELIHLLLHWSAKESIYKVLSYKDIEFCSQIHIEKFIPQTGNWSFFEAKETRSGKDHVFYIDYLVTTDYVLTVIK